MNLDLDPRDFEAALDRATRWILDYYQNAERWPVLATTQPGAVRAALPAEPPLEGEPLERILDDFETTIVPHLTHWNHPGFLAYLANTGSAPGILAEALSATLNVNGMLWRTSPAVTELEELTCDWLRQMLALPPAFQGHINDTASISTYLALAAARERASPEVRQRGLFGARPAVVYASDQAHSSVDKAAIGLGLGLEQVRRVASNAAFELDPAALEAAIEADRAAGRLPLAVVATTGTTSTGSLDPVDAIAELARRHGLWLHVDAAYGGSAAICPEIRARFEGLELADSIVVNPHKWLLVPVDCSVLFVRDPELLRRAFSVLPEYLKTPEQGVTNLMDYGLQLGRRFRALKLWFVLRAYGVAGLQAMIRQHCALAQRFAGWVHAEPGFELAAPVALSVVCFRATGFTDPSHEERFNERLLAAVNRAGSVFLSHSKLAGRYVLRVAIGNLKTDEPHLAQAWVLLREEAARLRSSAEPELRP